MTVRELISLLEHCDEGWNIEIAFILHGVARTLYPECITVVDDWYVDSEGSYHWRCIIDIWKF